MKGETALFISVFKTR